MPPLGGPPELELKGTREPRRGFEQRRSRFPKDRSYEVGTEESLELPLMSHSLSPSLSSRSFH